MSFGTKFDNAKVSASFVSVTNQGCEYYILYGVNIQPVLDKFSDLLNKLRDVRHISYVHSIEFDLEN